MTRPTAAFVALAMMATACATLEPPYRRPAAPVPTTWPQGPSYAPPQAGAPAGNVAWRSFFTDPSLRAAIDLGLAQNRDLRVAVANIEESRAQYRVQRSYLLPTVGASATATFRQGQTQGSQSPGTLGSAGSEGQQYSLQLGLSSYEIDLFGRVRSLSHAALEQYLATEEARRAVQISLIAEIAGDYLTLAADTDLLRVAQQTVAAQRASLDLTRARFNAGLASMIDVNQAATTVEQAQADVAQYTTQTAQDKNALNLVAGSTVPDSLLPSTLQGTPRVAGDLPAGLDSQVLLQRPDVLQAEHQLRAANADIGAARAAFFPTVSLTGGGGAASSALSQLFNVASRVWTFSPSVSVPIFTGGRNQANLRYAQAQRTAAVAQYERTIQTAFQEVADALARRGTIGQQLAAQQAATTAAAETLRLSTARYQRGSDPYLNVLDAQRTLYTAQRTLVSTQLIQATNAVILYRALGGGVT